MQTIVLVHAFLIYVVSALNIIKEENEPVRLFAVSRPVSWTNCTIRHTISELSCFLHVTNATKECEMFGEGVNIYGEKDIGCYLQINQIKEENNGTWTYEYESYEDFEITQKKTTFKGDATMKTEITLILLKEPSFVETEPSFHSENVMFNPGEMYQFSIIVRNVRPRPHIIWYLEEEILQDASNTPLNITDDVPEGLTVTQTVQLLLNASMHQKSLIYEVYVTKLDEIGEIKLKMVSSSSVVLWCVDCDATPTTITTESSMTTTPANPPSVCHQLEAKCGGRMMFPPLDGGCHHKEDPPTMTNNKADNQKQTRLSDLPSEPFLLAEVATEAPNGLDQLPPIESNKENVCEGLWRMDSDGLARGKYVWSWTIVSYPEIVNNIRLIIHDWREERKDPRTPASDNLCSNQLRMKDVNGQILRWCMEDRQSLLPLTFPSGNLTICLVATASVIFDVEYFTF